MVNGCFYWVLVDWADSCGPAWEIARFNDGFVFTGDDCIYDGFNGPIVVKIKKNPIIYEGA